MRLVRGPKLNMYSEMPFSDIEVLEFVLKDMNEHEEVVSKEDFIKHLKTPPKCTHIRVNPIATNKINMRDEINTALFKSYMLKGLPPPTVDYHSEVEDVLVVKSNSFIGRAKAIYPNVIVGLQCAIAVLRGSQVYAPGVTAIPSGVCSGDKVSVFADLLGQCKRGWNTVYNGPTYFVGNGLLKLNRQDIFTVAVPKGLAIDMREPIFDCPSIGDFLLENTNHMGLQIGFLQNLPSVLCGHALKPEPHHVVLDMCAAPGGKTTHIASLMQNKGTVIALDKSTSKIQQIHENSVKLGLTNIEPHVFDSTKACLSIVSPFEREKTKNGSLLLTPPFRPCSFDRILLDAPCSALGQRPQLHNPIRLKEVLSFAGLQKKLFSTAIELLKTGGRMVYSTCTYNVAENEGIVEWALKSFPCLRIVCPGIKLGKPGYKVGQLTEEQCSAMKRFGSPSACINDENMDTIGFFLCCFEKV